MRCCLLLALGLVIAPLGLQHAAAEEPRANELRKGDSAATSSDDAAQATLAALSTAVRVPPRRYAGKSSVADSGKPAPIVRLAKPSPYAPPAAKVAAAGLGGLETRLVSHNEAGAAPIEIPSEETPETSGAAVRPATAFTPTDVGGVEEEPVASVATPVLVSEKPVLQPVVQPAQSTISNELPAVRFEQPAARAEPSAAARTEPATTLTVKAPAAVEKRESSRAGGGFSNNPLRQAPPSAVIGRDLDNPLR